MYHWLERESEIELLVEDESVEAVFTEALVAIGDLISDERGGESVTHEVLVTATDRRALLGKWIAELVRLAETDGFVSPRGSFASSSPTPPSPRRSAASARCREI